MGRHVNNLGIVDSSHQPPGPGNWKLDPSFNACRETCRELAWHYNLIQAEEDPEAIKQQTTMMRFVARHLLLFVGGKLEQSGLGEFCCSSKPLRQSGFPTVPRAGENSATQTR